MICICIIEFFMILNLGFRRWKIHPPMGIVFRKYHIARLLLIWTWIHWWVSILVHITFYCSLRYKLIRLYVQHFWVELGLVMHLSSEFLMLSCQWLFLKVFANNKILLISFVNWQFWSFLRSLLLYYIWFMCPINKCWQLMSVYHHWFQFEEIRRNNKRQAFVNNLLTSKKQHQD